MTFLQDAAMRKVIVFKVDMVASVALGVEINAIAR